TTSGNGCSPRRRRKRLRPRTSKIRGTGRPADPRPSGPGPAVRTPVAFRRVRAGPKQDRYIMTLSHPESIRPILEWAEAGRLAADVPADRQDEQTYCAARGLISVSEPQRTGWTPCKTTRKQATALRPGDVVQFERGDLQGYKVAWVRPVPDADRPRKV